jgi:GxxExxY protein
LTHRGKKVREFEADFTTFGKIILELKALQSGFVRANYVQIISELKLWGMQLGLLVNFGLQKVNVERIPFTEKPKTILENYDYIKHGINEKDRNVLARLRDAVLHVFETHGLGYGNVVCQKLVQTELDFRKIEYRNRCPIDVKYEGEIISSFKMKPLLVEDRLICDIKALNEKIDFYDITKLQSYLRALGLKTGVIVSFGKTDLEIRGVRA